MKRCLIYDNRTNLAEALSGFYNRQNMEFYVAGDEGEFFAELEKGKMSLVLLDITMVEDEQAISVIRRVREKSMVPIIVASRLTNEDMLVRALSAGADDFAAEGCSILELIARIDCQIRRYEQLVSMRKNISQIYRVDDLEIDDVQRKVMVAKREVRLTPIEYQILKLLVQERGKVMSISEIYEQIWHMRAVGAENIIAVHIRHIREKIEQNPKQPRYLQVVWGYGYKVG